MKNDLRKMSETSLKNYSLLTDNQSKCSGFLFVFSIVNEWIDKLIRFVEPPCVYLSYLNLKACFRLIIWLWAQSLWIESTPKNIISNI